MGHGICSRSLSNPPIVGETLVNSMSALWPMWVSLNGGTPKAGWFLLGKFPFKWMRTGGTPILRNPQCFWWYLSLLHRVANGFAQQNRTLSNDFQMAWAVPECAGASDKLLRRSRDDNVLFLKRGTALQTVVFGGGFRSLKYLMPWIRG